MKTQSMEYRWAATLCSSSHIQTMAMTQSPTPSMASSISWTLLTVTAQQQ
jgi:hypothetical protein